MLYAERVCGPSGDCPDAGDSSCYGFACADVNNCATVCTGTTGCLADHFCISATFGDTCLPRRPDGDACTDYGDRACLSNHCQNGFCCAGGDCCQYVGHCPARYGEPDQCDEPLLCQGYRTEPICADHVCDSLIVEDDSLCAGQPVTDCGAGADVHCDASSEQIAPTCPATCAGDNALCDSGYYCGSSNSCLPQLGVGDIGCDEDSDCSSGHCDLSTTGSETGRCCAAGECCDADADCAGAQCVWSVDGTTTYGQCFPGGPGDPCDANEDCAAGNWCRESNDQCVAGADGAPCDDAGDCDAGICNASMVCGSALGVGGTGCDDNADCTSNYCDLSATGLETGRCCVAGECCDGDTDCPVGAWCVALIDGAPEYQCHSGSAGEPCDDDADCDPGNLCRESSDLCVSGAAGQPCDDAGDCDNPLICTATKACSATLGVGVSGCDDNADCASGHCDLSITGPETGRCCAAGECCDADADCAAGDQCVDLLDGTAMYRCYSGDAGQACDADDDCDSGHRCRESNNLCVTGDIGQPCDDADDCDGSYICTGSSVCSAVLGVGATGCNDNGDCLSGYCDLSLAGLELYRCCAAGECCDVDSDCPPGDQCIDFLDGVSIFRCYSGAVGQTCDDDPDCDAGLYCRESTNTCVNGDAGQPCDDNGDCDSGNWCRASVSQCVTGSIGAACDDSGDCDSGNYCAGSTCAAQLGVGQITCTWSGMCTTSYCDLSTLGPETGRCCSGSECCNDDADCPSGDHCVWTLDGVPTARCYSGASNATCDVDADCDSGNYCRESTDRCTTGAAGAPCDDAGDCDGTMICVGGTCDY